MVSATLGISFTLQGTNYNMGTLSVVSSRNSLTTSFIQRQSVSRMMGISFATHRRERATPSVTSKKLSKKKNSHKKVEEDEDAFEALFKQLEEDLANDELDGHGSEDDDFIGEDELMKLEQELAEALGDDELFGQLNSIADGENETGEEEEEDGEDGNELNEDNEEEEKETPAKLKSWQLQRLAYALKNGRRKTSIKNLAADLCLDRAVVLKLLRDPPPNLVMLSATIPDKPVSNIIDYTEKIVETVPSVANTHASKPKVEAKVPVHVLQNNWIARKRLKKVQLQTLEKVYGRTKRPTNAMISSIVHVTNLPRKRVVKWFEDKRDEDGVPEHRVPYQRSSPESDSSAMH